MLKVASKSGLILTLAVGLTYTMGSPAHADYRQMRNNPTYYDDATCSGDVWMNYFITDRTDISFATYYDQYQNSSGTWIDATARHGLYDSDSNDYRMITNLTSTRVRVRANHYVTTHQGPNCSG